MKTARLAAIATVITAVACGPVESFPPTNDAGTPTNDAGEMCAGVCVPGIPAQRYGPMLMWMGDQAAAPACPATAPFEAFVGYGYLDGSIPCDVCTCGPTNGSCAQPATVIAGASSCADDGLGVAHTSSEPPPSWGGLCNGENAIPAGKLCGGVPCVQSVTVAPLTAKQIGCLPSTNTNIPPPPPNRFARGCSQAGAPRACTTQLGKVCTPAAPGPEFKQCIVSTFGNATAFSCPPTYPDKSIFYDDGAPQCAPCACDAPTESTCTGSIQLFSDASCGAPLGASIPLDASGPKCVDVPPGSALGSKSASKAFYKPGSCHPSGGTPYGTAVCCMP